jgi:hypothetical protein
VEALRNRYRAPRSKEDRWTASGRSAREVGRRRLPGLFDNPPPPGRGIVTKEPTVPAFSY